MKVLVVSNDRVGSRMAGPAIRYYNFARELARQFEVTLMVPGPVDIEVEGFDVVQAQDYGGRAFRPYARTFDVLVAQNLLPWTMRALAKDPVRVVYDLYDPFLVENLGLFAKQETTRRYQDALLRANSLAQEVALATGDAFICASERQRDLWLGMLGALGRLDQDEYARDPSLRRLIDVVPFGLPAEPPVKTKPVLKGVVPGIEPGDRVLLWGGGIWNWFDPMTPIRAVGRLAERRGDVKLYFLGVQHPNPETEAMTMADQAVRLAEELGLLDRSVFFNFGWVPYEERADFLLEADLGVSAHEDNVETRFAFRTRMLDYLWAGLPIVTTQGDVLAELVEAARARPRPRTRRRRRLGRRRSRSSSTTPASTRARSGRSRRSARSSRGRTPSSRSRGSSPTRRRRRRAPSPSGRRWRATSGCRWSQP